MQTPARGTYGAMRLGLEYLDARGMVLDLGVPGASEEQKIHLRSTTALRGLLTSDAQGLRVSDLEAEWAVLDALLLHFGTVRVGLTREATLGSVRGSFVRNEAGVELSVASHGLHAAGLEIDAGSVRVRGEARWQGTRLAIQGSEGRLEAEQARMESFVLQVGDVTLRAPEVSAEALLVGWGEGGFRLEARRLHAPALSFRVGKLALEARGVLLTDLTVHGANITFAEATLAEGSLELALGTTHEPAPAKSDAQAVRTDGARRVFDWRLLDGLSGALNVDAVVDMTVPIIGQRRATHKFRLQVDDGSIDYRELESDLSALEESILDFAVRDDALVLERGIPLLPTRGFGKPLVFWDLGPEDLALAHKRRVRLSVLPSARLAKDLKDEREPKERESTSSMFALRRLGLEHIALKLSLNDVPGDVDAALKRLSWESLEAHGEIQHELLGEPRPGVVHAELHGLLTSVEDLALGTMRLDVASVSLGKLHDAAIVFMGLKPTHVRVAIAALTLRRAKMATVE